MADFNRIGWPTSIVLGGRVRSESVADLVRNSQSITETTATAEEMQDVLRRLPVLRQQGVHAGEVESLAVLVREEDLTLCTFDAAAIRALPFLDVSDRAVSAERLLRTSGLTLSPGYKLDPRLSEEYFKSNIEQGLREFVYSHSG